VRLLILSYIISHARSATFTELRTALGLTDGTLSVHLSRLERGGVITVQKRFVGKRPQTEVKMTAEGRRRFERYVAQLRQIVPGFG
jgi:DNA-binding transcriptional ArsR family regulator